MSARSRAKLTLLELLDEQLLPVAAAALVILPVGRWFASATTMGAGTRGALDFSLWWVWLASGGIAAWLGSRSLANPLYTGAARYQLAGDLPPARWALERLALCSLLVIGVRFVLAGVIGLGAPEVPLGAWIWTGSLEIIWIVLIGGLFGTLFRPLPTLALTLAVWWIGHLAGPWATVMANEGHRWAPAVLRVLPDLDVLDLHAATVRGELPSPRELLLATGWWTAWSLVALGSTVAILERRDL